MIDLNDVWSPPPRVDLAAVKAQLAATAAGWLPELFPQARPAPDRRTLRCADLSGRPPRKEGSCVLHLDGPYAGWGFDFDRRAGRPGRPDLSRHRAHRRRALRGGGPARAHGPATRGAAAEARLHARGPPHPRRLSAARGSPAETYLRSRGLSDPGSPDLLYHPT